MKGFILSLCVFALLSGGIVLNAIYIDKTCQKLSEELDALPPVTDATAQAAALYEHWEQEKGKFGISVSLQTLDKIDAIFAELDYAVRFHDAATFERCRALAGVALKEIQENEGLVPKNWI